MINHVTRQWFTRIGIFPGKPVQPRDLIALVEALRVVPIDSELIRVGPDGDGGYLLPDDLQGLAACFSPGVADCSDFELDLADRGMQVYLADRSVDGPATDDPRFRFIKRFIGSTTSEADGLVTMDDWCRDALGVDATGQDLVLQMDIEGAEYEVLHSLSDALLRRFRIIVIEFHRLQHLVDRFAFRWMASAIRKLLTTHAVVHMHPNNHRNTLRYAGIEIPALLEVTLWRRDRLQVADKPLIFPHPLDRDCNPAKLSLVLPDCWYRRASA
jgi:hypothetical protein